MTHGHQHVLVSEMYWDSVLVLCTCVLKMAQIRPDFRISIGIQYHLGSGLGTNYPERPVRRNLSEALCADLTTLPLRLG